MKNFFYKVNGQEYEVEIIYKRMKNVHYRFRDNKFIVSCNRSITKSFIESGLAKYGDKLIKASKKEEPITDQYIYIFGNKYDLTFPGVFLIHGYSEIKYKSKEELMKKIKPIFLDVLTKRVCYYEKLMGVSSYQVSVRNMKTRFGSNSKRTKKLNFALLLVHYSTPIIDSVIVHELAHIVEFNHSKKFYDVVYKYCPDYNRYRKLLLKGIYHD